ncbi:MAG: VanW family protein [Deltaproteobacteria bacterium]|nr:VanW family protein [Deltaproteobacteria bacterium]
MPPPRSTEPTHDDDTSAFDTQDEASPVAPQPTPPTRSFVTRARTILGATCLLLAAGLAGLALAEHARASRPPPTVEVRVGEARVEGDARVMADRLADQWESHAFVLQIGEERVEGTRARFGVRVDREALTRTIVQAQDPRSLLRRYHAQAVGGTSVSLSLPLIQEPSELVALLSERKDHIDRRARDARLEARTGRVLEETVGLHLDVFASAEAVFDAAREGRDGARALVVREEPHRTSRELRGVRIEAVLGTYETRYSTLEDARDRSFNLAVAASKVDGTVLMPGETFDFNDVVGERSEANGFRPAPQIAGGELIDGVGGGTCQVAGTLHAAAFFAGLPIVERSPHSRPSGYIWMGLDAVVVYPQLDLRFTNDFDFPIVLGMTVEAGTMRAEIRGARSDRMVTFTRRVDDVSPFTERDVPDPSLPSGVRVLRQRGVPGFEITRFRIVRDVAHNLARRTRWEDAYPPTEQIWRVGTGGPAPAGYVPPEGDQHLEYTADEILSASFGATVDGFEIARRAGRTGEPGWIVRAGMPDSLP